MLVRRQFTMTASEEFSPPKRGLGALAARGAALTIGAQLIRIVLQVVSVVVLSRLLSPQDYGLLAMVIVIIGVGEIFRDFGLSSAAIQAETLSVRQRDNLFWINLLIGCLLGGALISLAPVVALIFDQPELVVIAQTLASVFVLNGAATQFRAGLIRELKFKVLAIADVTAPALGLTAAVIAAAVGAEYWALVIQQLMQAVSLLAILWVGARWFPGLPRRGEPMRGFLKFGWNLVASQLVGYVSNNVDTLLIGIRFGPTPLGIYNRGFQLLMTPLNQIRSPLTTVALPVFSRLRSDRKRFNDFVARGQLALGYTLIAALGIVVSGAEPITALFLGDQWTEVGPILRFLAIAGISQTLAFVGYWVYVSLGLTGTLFRYSLISAAIKVVCVVVGSFGGVLGIAIGYAVAPTVSWPVSLWWLSRHTFVPVRRLYAGAGRVLVFVISGAAAGGIASYLAAPFGTVWQLAAVVTLTLVIYMVLGLSVRGFRADLLDVLRLVRFLKPGGSSTPTASSPVD